MLGDPPLVGRVEIGEEEADRDRLGAALADELGEALWLALGEGLDDPLGPDPLGGLEAQLAARPAGVGFGAQSR